MPLTLTGTATYRERQHKQGPWAVVRGELGSGIHREIGKDSQERGRGPEREESEIRGVDKRQNRPQTINLRNIASDFANHVGDCGHTYHEVCWPLQSKG